MTPQEIITDLRRMIADNLDAFQRNSSILPQGMLDAIQEHHSKIDAALHDALNKFTPPH